MGEKKVYIVENAEQRKTMIRHILSDIKAFEAMLNRKMFESDRVRIGAEQEFCLVDCEYRPALKAMDIMGELDPEFFTTELAQFNLEANLDPQDFKGTAFSKMERQLRDLIGQAKSAAEKHGARVLFTGILPTIHKSDLDLENITPDIRYQALNESMVKARGGDFNFHIKGQDELVTRHPTMTFEACNTSFQIHLQIPQDEIVSKFNWAQAIAGPVLAACTNSPLLFGKRLWKETRIAVFEQSVDLRNLSNPDRETISRVHFGFDWVRDSITEVFKSDIARYKLLLASDMQEDAIEVLRDGGIPKLRGLNLHNGTIYKWNRVCYGITGDQPHLRIENRYIPSGPTISDEMANSAFWVGLMNGLPEHYLDIHNRMDFDDAKTNFLKAARNGLSTQFNWVDGRMVTATELLKEELIPLAREGLKKAKISKTDIDFYMRIIEERVESCQTGADWMLRAYNHLKKNGSPTEERIVAITGGLLRRQQEGKPVHTWDLPDKKESGNWASKYKYVRQVMSRDLYTVQDTDQIELATSLMDWGKMHHILVENSQGDLVGVITSSQIIKHYSNQLGDGNDPKTVDEIMHVNPMSVEPNSLTADALNLMRRHGLSCLPVTKNQKLIGILTEFDFIPIAEQLFEELRETEKQEDTGKPVEG